MLSKAGVCGLRKGSFDDFIGFSEAVLVEKKASFGLVFDLV